MGVIEFCWNVFPPRAWVSLLLFITHLIILGGQFFLGKRWDSPYQVVPVKVKNPIKFD